MEGQKDRKEWGNLLVVKCMAEKGARKARAKGVTHRDKRKEGQWIGAGIEKSS